MNWIIYPLAAFGLVNALGWGLWVVNGLRHKAEMREMAADHDVTMAAWLREAPR